MPTSSPAAAAAPARPNAYLTALALPFLVLLGSLLGGATQRWSEGIVVAAFALWLLVKPPRNSLGPALNILALLFLAFAATAFLPARWFAFPEWRTALTNDFGLNLPATLSPQPWLSLDSSFTLLAGLVWLYYVAAIDLDLRDVRRAARFFCGAIIALAALSIFLYLRHTALPFWHNVRGFGPYPNRNQTGDLFGVATVLTLGCLEDDFRRHHKRWLLWLVGVGVLIAAIVLDFSRAGILILILGTTAWLLRLSLRKWSGASVAVGASLLLLLLVALLLFGGETVARFHLRLDSDESMTADFRWLIFRDCWTMIRDSPWCGLSLGNFESVFALFRHVSQGPTRSLHPESDWLWLWSEMGWPGVALVLVALALFVRRAFPLREGTNQRLRYAALLGALLFALHGFVDVSAHRFGTFLAGTFLLGCAQLRPAATPARRWPPIVFRCLALVLLVVAISWCAADRSDVLLPGYVGVENARESATMANRGHDYTHAIIFCDQGLQWAPLDWQLYFLRALGEAGLRRPPAIALADFRRARFLEPSAYQLPFEEGKTWLGLQPVYALTAWHEALHRRPNDPGAIYSLMFPLAAQADRKVLTGLADFAAQDPRLTITYLENIPGDAFPQALQDLLARDPELARLSTTEKHRLFALWSRREQLGDLARAVAAHPAWMEFAWPGVARWHATRGEFEAAWQLVRQHAPPPPLPAVSNGVPTAQLQQQVYAPGTRDYAAGYALYRAQISAGQTNDALDTIRHFTAQPDAPAYFKFLEAQAWAAQGNWERAWQSWEQFQETERALGN